MQLKRSILKRVVKWSNLDRPIPKWHRSLADDAGYCVLDAASLEDVEHQTLPAVWPEGISRTAVPAEAHKERQYYEKPIRELQPIILEDVTVWPDSSVVAKSNCALVDPMQFNQRREISLENGASVLRDFGGRLILNKRPSFPIEKGISLFGHGATNWFHWLVEVLSKASFLHDLPTEFSDFPLLVPETVGYNNSFRQSLELFANGREIIPLASNTQFDVKRLIILPTVSYGPVNMQDGHWPLRQHYMQHNSALKHFRKTLFSMLEIEEEALPSKRLFIERPNTRRSYNQEALKKVAQSHCLEVVKPETMTFRQQVELFHSSEFVAGATGAAWSGGLFMRPGSSSLIWTMEQYREGCFFSNLAEVAGSDQRYIFVKPDKELSSTHMAYSASFELNPEDFDAQLAFMLGSKKK